MPVGNEMALLARPVNLAKDWRVLLANDLGFFRVAWLAVNAVRFRVKPSLLFSIDDFEVRGGLLTPWRVSVCSG